MAVSVTTLLGHNVVRSVVLLTSLSLSFVKTVLVTGGAGFIGSNLVRHLLRTPVRVVVLDALTYAGNLANLDGVIDGERCVFVRGTIGDRSLVAKTVTTYAVTHLVNCAAESHVDRSIHDSRPFLETNIMGTQVLLDVAREMGIQRFLQMSTDEVYGSLTATDEPFSTYSPLRPSSPYSASKAAADMLVGAAVHTHGLHAIVTRCSNNYGPYQFPEKFIPLMIVNALSQGPLPIYGDGRQVRDWIHVDDHCRGVMLALEHGNAGDVFLFGGNAERSNLDVVTRIVQLTGASASLIRHVDDRPGHDRRYAVNTSDVEHTLGWKPIIPFEEGLEDTVRWYAEHSTWWHAILSGEYRTYVEQTYPAPSAGQPS